MKYVPLLGVAVLLGLATAVFGQETGRTSISRRVTGVRSPGVRELAALLQQTIDLNGFHKPQSLKEALALLQERVLAGGGELPIHVDLGAFKEENPEGANIYDTQIEFPEHPRQMRLVQVLHFMLNRVDPPNATFLIRPGVVVITTISEADLSRLLAEGVHMAFQRRPLLLVLEELYESTGVPIIVDPRARRQVQKPVSASFTNGPSLGGVLVLLSEMAGLKMLVGDNVVYITTPTHARQLLRERLWVPVQMQQTFPSGSMGYMTGRQKRVE
jgi:hypothetical protein